MTAVVDLDLPEAAEISVRGAAYVSTLGPPEVSGILAVALPTVAHVPSHNAGLCCEHQVIDTRSAYIWFLLREPVMSWYVHEDGTVNDFDGDGPIDDGADE